MWCQYCLMWNGTIKCGKTNKRTTECDKIIVTCDVGTVQCKDRNIKCENIYKGTIKYDKNTVKCDVGTVECDNGTIKCEKR